MLSKTLHPARRKFRQVLLGLMGISFLFLFTVIGMRIHYRDGHIDGPMQTAMFEADVLQHKALVYISDDAQDFAIAEKMLRYGFFSPIYTRAGLDMMAQKADEGYGPAVVRVAALENQGIQVRR